MTNKKIKIIANGVVQGVGFRPFVFNLAKKYSLGGFVRNTGFGVEIVVNGKKESIEQFISVLKKSKFDMSLSFWRHPERSEESKSLNDRILRCTQNDKGFRILPSKKTEILSEFPSDLAVCPKCQTELFSENNRRYKYPFINCTACGPRFSIIKKLPYDRKNTSMREFKMCPECQKEYDNPSDRRFHAQPNACPVCGPKLSLFDKNRKLVSQHGKALEAAVKLLKNGKILAVKGIGGYHLMCDAANKKAVELLRKRKHRPTKPFAVMTNLKTAKNLCRVNKYEEKALLSPAAPIVILKNSTFHFPLFTLSFNNTLGVMLPYAPLHHLLIKEIPVLVATSGNKSDEPIAINEKEAFNNLKDIADYFLTHNREIENRSDDSIVRFLPNSNKKIIIRRSRGYVPQALDIDIKTSVFAAGGDLKNNFCITRNGKAYLSQYIGDLAEKSNLDFYVESIKKMKSFLEVNPRMAVCDAHPGYYSFNAKYKKLYHHYAHIASVIAEHKLKGKVLGFAFDGTGYGADSSSWGGEIILFDGKEFSKVAGLEQFNLPGGEICSKEIWRNAVSLLHKYNFDSYIPKLFGIYPWKTIVKMIDNNLNSPTTSSAGRLFDAVAALTGVKIEALFEAEGAMALEALAKISAKTGKYKFEFKDNKIILEDLIKGIVKDLDKKVTPAVISSKFHNTMVEIIIEAAKIYSKKYKTKTIALSGGVFQNMVLLENTVNKLKNKGFKVFFNEKVPANDGGIALGQLFMLK